MKNKEKQFFGLIPTKRLYTDYPWYIWAAGWLCLIKGAVWLLMSPGLEDDIIKILTYKHLIFMFPFLIFGVALFNFKKYGAIGAAFLSFAELIFLFYPGIIQTLRINQTSNITIIFSIIEFFIYGPVSSLYLIVSAPFIIKYIKYYKRK